MAFDHIYRNRRITYFLLILFIPLVVYSNSISNGFISDDHSVIQHNPTLQGDALRIFQSIDTTSDTLLLPYYRPLTYLTFWAEGRLHGFNPLFMHLFNVLLHVMNVLLFYIVVYSVSEDYGIALLAGLLFAVHPVNSEAVNFLSGGRNTLLACMFSLLTYLVHRKGGLPFALLGSLFFFAGLLSKESGMMVLFIIIIFLEAKALWRGVLRERLKALLRLAPYGAMTLLYLIMRWRVLSPLGIQDGLLPGISTERLRQLYVVHDLGERLRDNIYIIPRYLQSLILPYALSPRHVVPEDLHLYALGISAGWFFIIGLFLWFLLKGRNYRPVQFGITWSVLFWIPVSGIFFFSSVNMADRFIYQPAMGVWILIAFSIKQLVSTPFIRRYGRFVGIAILVILSVITFRRNMDWRDDTSLFTRLVSQFPENPYGHFNLGSAYIEHYTVSRDPKYLGLSEREMEIALSIDPGLQEAYTALGYVKLEKGDFRGAIYYYTRALEYFPLNRDARINRAIAYERIGMLKEALADYRFYLTIPTFNNIPNSQEYAAAKVRELESLP